MEELEFQLVEESEQQESAHEKYLKDEIFVQSITGQEEKDNSTLNINKICRICLCVNEQRVKMEDTYFGDVSSLHLYEDICKVKVELDIFPTIMCMKCLNELRKIYDFIEKIRHSHMALESASREIYMLKDEKDSFDFSTYHQRVLNILKSITKGNVFNDDKNICSISESKSMLDTAERPITCGEDSRGEHFSDSDDDTPLAEKLPYQSTKISAGHSKNTQARAKRTCRIKNKTLFNASFPASTCQLCSKKIRNPFKHMLDFHSFDLSNLKCLKCGHQGDSLDSLIEHCSGCLKHDETTDGSKLETPNTNVIPDEEVWESEELDRPRDNSDDESEQLGESKTNRTGRRSKFLCKLCDISYNNYDNIEAHLKSVHSTESKCIICTLAFNNSFSLLYHMMVKHGKLKCCRLCLISFKSYDELNVHYKSNEHNTKCTVCGEQFKNRKAVYEHRRRKHLNPQGECQKFKCPECPREFANSNNIRRHILVAHNDMRFLCDTCGQSYTTKRNLTLHIQKFHQGIPVSDKPVKKNFFCESCGRELKIFHKYAIAMHRAKHKGHNFVCKKCYDSFATEEEFKRHVVEFGHQLFECDKCQSQFVREENFKLHLKNHDAPGWNKNMFASWGKSAKLRNEKGEFVCSYCPKVFKDKQRLDNHVRVHTNERPYKCHICSKGFKTWIHRKTHLNIHLGIKKWTCKFCSKSFTNSCTLKGHEMIHTGERPHRCPECRKGFITMSAMKKHRVTHYKTSAGGNTTKDVVAE